MTSQGTTIPGSTVLVTGGQRGLGRAFVDELLAQGAAKVYATARIPAAAEDARIVPLALDVRDPALVAAVAEAAGDVTILVNNAGAFVPGSLLDADLADVQDLFDTNVFGVLRLAQAFAPILARNGGGAMINVASVLSWIAGSGTYGATKAALWSLTNSLRLELAGQGTQVVGVHLGYTDTDMTAGLDVPKNDPRQVARDTLLGMASGDNEILADDVSRYFKSVLSGPVERLAVRTAPASAPAADGLAGTEPTEDGAPSGRTAVITA